MTATNTDETAERKRQRVPEQEPGADAPACPEDCYLVEPGETGTEYYDPGRNRGHFGIELALVRAQFLSVYGPPQHVTRLQPGFPPKTFRWYRGGRDFSPVTGTGD
jgi:hypothetical protein